MIDVEQTIISQYANSATITALIQGMNAAIDPTTDFDNFYDFVWNVETAQGFGLDIWGRIVNVGRYVTLPDSPDFFGFAEGFFPFNQASFFNGQPPSSTTYRLEDEAYRRLILVKALSNISAMNAKSINTLLTNMFQDRGRCYVMDLGGMAMRYIFEFALEPYEIEVLRSSGAIPHPAGVKVTMMIVDTPTFGFEEAGPPLTPFDEGPFYDGTLYAID